MDDKTIFPSYSNQHVNRLLKVISKSSGLDKRLTFQARYIDYFEQREKRKDEYVNYYENSILVKGERDASKDEYPAKNPAI